MYLAPAPSRAHFVLQSPPAVYEQSNYGDPQKAPPCGADGSEVGTGVVTAYMGGDKLMITIDETIYHPGHYRVALAINDPSELPPEPPVTPNNTDCGTAPIDAAPVFPVLADGLWVHDAPFGAPQSVEITLPTDVDCANCTLQVIHFMSNHGLNNPGGCYYHHCAAISIQSTQGGTTGGEETGGEGEATASPTTTMTTAATMTAPTSTTNPDETASSGGGTGDEEDLLHEVANPTEFYDEIIAPYKGALEKWYVQHATLTNYFLVIFVTAWVVFFPKSRIAWSVFADLPAPPPELRSLAAA